MCLPGAERVLRGCWEGHPEAEGEGPQQCPSFPCGLKFFSPPSTLLFLALAEYTSLETVQSCAGNSVLLCLFLLQLSTFLLFLAPNAVASPGDSFQPAFVDLVATLFAFAIRAFRDVRERVFHHLQKLPVIIAARKQKLLLIGAGGAIGDILCGIRRLRRASIFFGT